jgi:peptidoglycan hydrolase-like protein with peptidoglycan-binding domain
MTNSLTLNKVAAALVGVAMVAGVAFAFTASRAHAVTLSELVELFIALEVIPADKADEARTVLSGQEETNTTTTTTTTTSNSAAMTCNFTRNLNVGATGADVMELQKLLNAKGYTVAAAGAGSPGMESQYYGPATKAAVAKMQTAFAAEILAPLGLTTGTGFFGASTRAKANTLCAATTPEVPATGDDDDDDTTGDDDDDTDLSGGEASLTDFSRTSSPSAVTVEENEEEVEVAGFEFDVDDADAALKRVDVRFETTDAAPASNKPYEYFESVQLLLDGEKIAEVDTGSKSDWEDLAGNAWEISFTGLDEKMTADETAKLTIAVTTQGTLDTDDESTTWNVWIPNDGIRARDGENLDQYIGDADSLSSAAEERQFDTEGAGAGEELKVSLASSNPDASVIRVDDTDSTDDVTVLVFELKAEESDIEITSLPLLFTIGGDQFDQVISDVSLDIDGTVYDDYTTTGATTGSATTTFDIDSGDLVIEKDSKVTVKVMVDLLKTSAGTYSNGTTITASLRDFEVDAIEAEGKDTIADADLTGTAIGDAHTLQSSGIFAEIVSIDEIKTAGDNNDADSGDFKIKFDVSAFDNTYYISATTTSVFDFDIENGSGVASTTETAAAVAAVSSTATKEGSAYRIDDGDTETFTLTLTLNPSTDGYYRAQLQSIDFGDTSSNTTNQTAHTASPEEDFESDNLFLNA